MQIIRKLTLVLVLFLSTLNGLAQQVKRDTVLRDNGLISEIYDYDYTRNILCGYYAGYDSLGHKRVEGNYTYSDSIPCKSCYEGFTGGNLLPYSIAITTELRTGEWFFYYPNGQVSAHGFYAAMVHEFSGTYESAVYENKPQNVYVDKEFLKAGSWEHFNPDGKHTQTIEYVDGEIVFITSYE